MSHLAPICTRIPANSGGDDFFILNMNPSIYKQFCIVDIIQFECYILIGDNIVPLYNNYHHATVERSNIEN